MTIEQRRKATQYKRDESLFPTPIQPHHPIVSSTPCGIPSDDGKLQLGWDRAVNRYQIAFMAVRFRIAWL